MPQYSNNYQEWEDWWSQPADNSYSDEWWQRELAKGTAGIGDALTGRGGTVRAMDPSFFARSSGWQGQRSAMSGTDVMNFRRQYGLSDAVMQSLGWDPASLQTFAQEETNRANAATNNPVRADTGVTNIPGEQVVQETEAEHRRRDALSRVDELQGMLDSGELERGYADMERIYSDMRQRRLDEQNRTLAEHQENAAQAAQSTVKGIHASADAAIASQREQMLARGIPQDQVDQLARQMKFAAHSDAGATLSSAMAADNARIDEINTTYSGYLQDLDRQALPILSQARDYINQMPVNLVKMRADIDSGYYDELIAISDKWQGFQSSLDEVEAAINM